MGSAINHSISVSCASTRYYSWRGACINNVVLESTLKRHGYYCRSRRGGSTARSRSCMSCARGKARCDNAQPECSRCINKAIECHYPANTAKSIGPRIQHSGGAPTGKRQTGPSSGVDFPSVEGRQEASNNGDITRDDMLVIPNPEFANLGPDDLGWDGFNIDFGDFLDPQTNNDTIEYPSSASPSLMRHSTPSTDETVQVQQGISPPKASIPTLPTFFPRLLVQRPEFKIGPQRTAKLIFHTLRSYPLMMLRQDSLPPFIHPHLLSSDIEKGHMEPLTNCMSLVRMISSGSQGSRKLFWRNVRLECERLCEEVR